MKIKKVGKFKFLDIHIYINENGKLYFRDMRLSSRNYGAFYNKYIEDKNLKIVLTNFEIV